MRDPSAWSQIGGWFLALAFILVIYGGWALVVHAFKTPTPTRPAAQPRVGVGPKCVACGKPAAKAVRAGYDSGWLLCLRCREEVDALTGRAS